MASPWILAARPKTLPAAVVPVAVGSALAYRLDRWDAAAAAVCLTFALLAQVATNYANDYYDWLRGADTPQRAGPLRVTAAGLVSPEAMRRALYGVFGAAFLSGLPLVFFGGGWLLPVGIVSLAAAWAYTGGPYPLAYHGWGDAFVLVFFGWVAVAGTVFAQAGQVPPEVWLAGASVGLMSMNLLAVNNARDRQTDAAVGKRTLAVRLGPAFARWQVAVQYGVAFGLLYPLGRAAGTLGVCVALLAVPLALSVVAGLWRAQTPGDYNRCLGRAAAALLLHGLGLAGGLAFG